MLEQEAKVIVFREIERDRVQVEAIPRYRDDGLASASLAPDSERAQIARHRQHELPDPSGPEFRRD